MYYINQLGEKDCGFTCLKMILASLNKRKDFLYLPLEKEGAYSFLELVDIAALYNLELGGYNFIYKEDIISSLKGYAILSLEIDNLSHAVILKKINKKRARIVDPALGEYSIKTKDLFSKWDGKALLVDSYLPYKDDLKVDKIELKGGRVNLILLKTLSVLSLFIGLTFINNTHYLFPIIFLLICAIAEILYRFMCIKEMKLIDQNFLSRLDSPLKNKEELGVYEEYKSKYLSLPISIIFSLVISIFLIFLCIYNSVYNTLFIGVIIFFSFFEKFFLSKSKQKEETDLERKEDDLFNENEIPFKEKFLSLHQKTYKYTYKENITKFVSLFFIIITILLSMYFQKILSLTYVLFYFALSLYFKDNLDKVICFDQELKKYRLIRARYSSLVYRLRSSS